MTLKTADFRNKYVLTNSLVKDINIFYTFRDLITTYVIFFVSFYFLNKTNNIIVLIFAVFFLGVAFNWINVQVHEACHYLLLKNKKFNDYFANLFYGIFSLRLVDNYRSSHWAHHKKLHDTREDPDYHMYNTSLFKGILYDLSLLTIWKFVKERNISNWDTDKKNKSTNLIINFIFLILSEVTIFLLIYLFLEEKNIINILKVQFLYHYSLFAVSLSLIRIRTRIQHASENYEKNEVSRTTLCNFFETFFIGCRMNYHFEHHMFPNIPYYRFNETIMKNKDNEDFNNFYTKTYLKNDLN